jgi:hypothetical protein
MTGDASAYYSHSHGDFLELIRAVVFMLTLSEVRKAQLTRC